MASQQSTAPDLTSVYRYYDQLGVLIYVGITRQGVGRNVQHNQRAAWWPYVARQEVEHYPTRPAASMREKALIRTHRPPFNKQHNPDHAEMRAAYLRFVSAPRETDDRASYVRDLNRRLPLDIVSYEDGLLVLRSRLEHSQVGGSVQRGDVMPIRGRRRKYGVVDRLEVRGPVVTLYARMRAKQSPPEDGFSEAAAAIGWSNNTKPPYPYIRQVLVVENDLAPGWIGGRA